MAIFYLSYATETKFLSGCYVEADDEDSAKKEAKRQKLSRKGQVLIEEVPKEFKVRNGYMNRRLDPDEIAKSIYVSGSGGH